MSSAYAESVTGAYRPSNTVPSNSFVSFLPSLDLVIEKSRLVFRRVFMLDGAYHDLDISGLDTDSPTWFHKTEKGWPLVERSLAEQMQRMADQRYGLGSVKLFQDLTIPAAAARKKSVPNPAPRRIEKKPLHSTGSDDSGDCADSDDSDNAPASAKSSGISALFVTPCNLVVEKNKLVFKKVQVNGQSLTFKISVPDTDASTFIQRGKGGKILVERSLAAKIQSQMDERYGLGQAKLFEDLTLPAPAARKESAPRAAPESVEEKFFDPMEAPASQPWTDAQKLSLQEQALFKRFCADSERIFAAAQIAEQQSIQAVSGNPEAVNALIASKKEEDRVLAELASLKERYPAAYKYYQTFYQKLTGICLASYSIKSGMIANANQSGSAVSYAGNALSYAGEVVPAVGSFLKIIGALLKLKDVRENHHAVSRLTDFFADLNESLKVIKIVALLLSREQMNNLGALKPQGKIKAALHAIEDWFLRNEADNPVVVKAVEDCEKVLKGVFSGHLTSDTSSESIVRHVLGRLPSALPITHVAATPMAAAAGAAAPISEPADKDEVSRLREMIEAMQRKADAQDKQIALLLQRNSGERHSHLQGNGGQCQVEEDLNPERNRTLHAVDKRLAALEAHTERMSQAVAVVHEAVKGPLDGKPVKSEQTDAMRRRLGLPTSDN